MIVKNIFKLTSIALVATSLATPALADLAKGNEAFKARDYATAKIEFEALPKDGTALYKLGLMYMNGLGIEMDAKQGRELVKKSADLGYTGSQLSMGRAYQKGIGLDVDLVQAYYYYKLAAQYSGSAQESVDELTLKMTKDQLQEAEKLLAMHSKS